MKIYVAPKIKSPKLRTPKKFSRFFGFDDNSIPKSPNLLKRNSSQYKFETNGGSKTLEMLDLEEEMIGKSKTLPTIIPLKKMNNPVVSAF